MICCFLRAQLIIMAVTGALCGVGFFFLGMKNPVGPALLTAGLDVLPFVGTGIVLIPLGIWQVIQGEVGKAVICLVLYIACAFSRELLEPKLIGQRLGIFPVVILVSIYAGIKLYGLTGIILGPLSVLILMEIYKQGKEKGQMTP